MSNVTRLPPFPKMMHVEVNIPMSQRESANEDHPTTGSARRLVRFLAGVYNGQVHPFDPTELRGLDTSLANACLDYLNYDRLGHREVPKHLSNGERDNP